ncbi:MAG: glycosyltransferase family 2 protein [Clostridiales bacterium]|nr:glycosyltransferase family 2 protein [Clostridiales bacterium]
MKLNCVILNYNDARTTAGLVRRIRDYDILDGIVVVDNRSTDDSMKRLEALRDEKVTVIGTERNGGYGYGNNRGVRYAAGKNGATHVLIANPDVNVSERCVCAMLQIFAGHSEVGVVSARMRDEMYGDLKNAWPSRTFSGELLAMGPISRRLFRGILEYPVSYMNGKQAVYVDTVHGSLLMVDVAKFLQCGGYDEHMFLYQEESVLAWRMRKHGFRTVLIRNHSYRHAHSVSISKSFSGQMERQKLRERSVMYYLSRYLQIGFAGKLFTKIWFLIIRAEIRTAEVFDKVAVQLQGNLNER